MCTLQHVTENKEENYLEIYIFQASSPLSLPLLNIQNCQSVLKIPVTLLQIVYICMTAKSPNRVNELPASCVVVINNLSRNMWFPKI